MKNKMIDVARQMKIKLKALSSMHYVGYYPTNFNDIGENSPAVLIQIGDVEYNSLPGKMYESLQQFKVHVYTNDVSERLVIMTDACIEIIETLLTDLSVSNTAECIRVDNVETGDELSAAPKDAPGYFDNITHYIINFTVGAKTYLEEA